MYRKQDWAQDWDGASGRPKVVPPWSAETEVRPSPGSIRRGPSNPCLEGCGRGPHRPPRRRRPGGGAPRCRQHPARIPARTPARSAAAIEPPQTRARRCAVLAAAGASWFGYDWWTVGRFTVSTDDAYVEAYNTTLAAKVPGYVASVLVDRQQPVHAGDVIATIDDGDYRLAADSAREKAATQQATIERIGHQIDAQQAAVAQAKAQLVSAKAAAKALGAWSWRGRTCWRRRISPASKRWSRRKPSRDQAVAGVQGAQAALESAAANVDVLKGQQQEAIDTLAELKTALAKAERDLSFTVIRAPIDGVIGNRAVQIGDYMQPGQRLASLVPLDDVYVDANFKETQLARLRPGQPVSIAVDALPEHDIHGTVESLSPASGSVFSLLPPDNATGNFTKIVQRLPVRIRVPAAVAGQGVLRPGMSVVVSVNTKQDALDAAAMPQHEAAR